MAKSFNLAIVTPEKTVYEGKVSSLVAPSKLGYLGVLAGHAPLIAALGPGRIILKESPAGERVFKCAGGGMLEVLKNNVTILIDQDRIS